MEEQGGQDMISATVLKEKRRCLRLTQKQVAERARISLQQYQKLESGSRSIMSCAFRLACRVIEALNMDVSMFYHGEYDASIPPIA